MKLDRPPVVVACIPLGLGLVSSAFYFIQGGFGAGHGRFDFFVILNALPFVRLLESWPLFAMQPELLWIVWVPALINATFLFLLGFAVEWIVNRMVK